tara:strand:+ start:608 stop:1639 length:1032 start_codon:yes stop_codon:yes gene_type:complete
MKYLILIIIILIIIYNKNIYANNLFETKFYDVNFSSKSIDDDKIKEINKIKIVSLLSILKNTLTIKNFDKVSSMLSDDLSNSFIKNIIINDEKIIDDKYISKIKVNFNKKKIIKFFREKNIPYVEYFPKNFLLIIYEKEDFQNNLFTKNNKHYKYLNNYSKKNIFFKVPNLDINDRFILNNKHLDNRDYLKIKNFSKKYNSNEYIIVIADINKNDVNYNIIYNSNGKILEKKFQFDKNNFDLLFKKLETETLNLWKQTNQIQNNSLNLLTCKVNYFNMLELKEIRNNLNNVSIIKDLEIKKISYKNIEYNIFYYGNLKILNNILNLNKLSINQNEDFCTVKLK